MINRSIRPNARHMEPRYFVGKIFLSINAEDSVTQIINGSGQVPNYCLSVGHFISKDSSVFVIVINEPNAL